MTRKLPIAIIAFVLQTGAAQPPAIPPKSLPALFPGSNLLSLIWTNTTAQTIDTAIKGKLYQTSSKLALLLPTHIETTLRLLPHQTAFVPISIEAPEVRGKTRFLIAWENAAQNLGKTEFDVYPRGILHELQTIAGQKALGLLTTNASFRQAFLKAGLQYNLVNKDQIPTYDGQLLIVDDDTISKQTVLAAVRRGVTIVSITSTDDDVLTPSFSITPCGPGVAIFVDRQFLDDFDTDPESQVRLVKLCSMAEVSAREDSPTLSKEPYEK